MPKSPLQSLFFLYMDSLRRRAALAEGMHSDGDSYLLFGLEEYLAAGYAVRHNLESARRSSRSVHLMSHCINKGLGFYGGIGGDFRSIIACRSLMNRSDIILSTVDPVGLPLAFFKAWGLIKSPAVYTSVGLPERIGRFSSARAVAGYRKVLAKMDGFIAYGYEECRLLRDWLGQGDDFVNFVPFGVDADYFSASQGEVAPGVDLLSIGADPQRDFALLFDLARARPQYRIEVITSAAHRASWPDVPDNVRVLSDIPLIEMKGRMEAATAVLLPIKENSYSGATTTLLQAMAMERPVVVSRVGAISQGYHLKDGQNCLLVEPGVSEELICKTDLLLADETLQRRLGDNACKTVHQNLTWKHYMNRMQSVLQHCYQKHATTHQGFPRGC